eukprot:CAMPEP_0117555500 /NCGR_PEP_ID=MMETSP0784-20121206/51307_1 /TAXON_ID=39447 /ORGANISM="" /LENGTH=194 /DNA_ID=CAMNT_0005352709 /DNA_START=77 /DNA_END=661 /DNA_ORIENTATION=-
MSDTPLETWTKPPLATSAAAAAAGVTPRDTCTMPPFAASAAAAAAAKTFGACAWHAAVACFTVSCAAAPVSFHSADAALSAACAKLSPSISAPPRTLWRTFTGTAVRVSTPAAVAAAPSTANAPCCTVSMSALLGKTLVDGSVASHIAACTGNVDVAPGSGMYSAPSASAQPSTKLCPDMRVWGSTVGDNSTAE